MNFIEFFNPSETQTSCLLEMLLSYQNRQQKPELFISFAEKFLAPLGFDVNLISHPNIRREYKHIDLFIHERNKYAIIYENKLKRAPFQRNQLARYIQTIRNEGYNDNQIFIVLVPFTSDFDQNLIAKSVWRLPSDGLISTNEERRCKWGHGCWCDDSNVILTSYEEKHCLKCNINLKKEFYPRSIILGKDFSQWMIDCEATIEQRERNVRSALLQFADYLNSLYNNKLNTLMENEIDEYLESQLSPVIDKEGWKYLRRKLEELDELKEGIERIRRNVSRNLIDKWYDSLKEKWSGMLYEPNESFGYIIDKNIWVGCKFYYKDKNDMDTGYDDQPFWGFRRIDGKDASQRQEKLVRAILAQCDNLNGEWEDDSYIVWGNTLNGDIRCDNIFSVAKKLGLL